MVLLRLCCLLFFIRIALFSYSQGLLFQANDKPIKERTSLQIFPDEDSPSFTDHFQLSFELSIRNPNQLGYLFLLKGKEYKENFSFTYAYLDGQKCNFKFNIDGKKNCYTLNLDHKYLKNKWIPVSFLFNLQQDSLVICIGEHKDAISNLELHHTFSPQLYFGRYDYILDVPSFAIRNLKLTGDKQSFSFPLNESSRKEVHSSTGKVYGKVINPLWLINRSYHWELLFENRSQTPSGITYDENKQRLIAFNQDSLLIYDLQDHKQIKYPYSNPLPVHLQLATHFFNTSDGKLYSYELNGIPTGDISVAALDIDKQTWTSIGKTQLPTQLHHHNGFWDKTTGKYIIFGGFGSKRYNNTLQAYDIISDRWDTISIKGDFISPRCFSGIAVNHDQQRLYIYGGQGNDSGDQSVGHDYLSDLHLIDLEKKHSRKLWPKMQNERLVSVRDMILTEDEKHIYTLCYPEYFSETYLQLYQLGIEDGTVKTLGDSILLRSNEIATNANLYYNQITQEFYCTTLEFEKNGSVTTRVYRLFSPPVSLAEVQLYDKPVQKPFLGYYWIIGSFVLLLIIIYIIYRYKKKASTIQKNSPEEKVEAKSLIITPAPTVSEMPDSMVQEALDIRSNAIYLFGPFTVIDRKGRDITHLFSARLRQVFVYILLHGTNGVLSISLNEVFWPDKTDNKVKNLKGVTINQIRKNLSELDGIELVHNKGYFQLIFTDCYCDYLRFRTLKGTSEVEKELVSLLMRGKFLEGFDLEILDQYKSQVEEFLFSFLPIEIEHLFKAHKYDAVIRSCHILSKIDPLNKTALMYSIHAMNQTGASQKAIMLYSQFAREYKQTMNEVFSISYNILINDNPPFHRDNISD